MPAWLIKLALTLAPSEKLFKSILVIFMMILFFLLMLIAAPVIVFTYIPYGKTTDHFQYYSRAVAMIKDETTTTHQHGLELNWQEVMAIDAVLLEQNFDLSSESRAYETARMFVIEEEELIEETCYDEVPLTDASGNIVKDQFGNPIMTEEEYDCSYTITVYYEKSFDEVLFDMTQAGLISVDQIEDVKRYTYINLEREFSYTYIPNDWEPNIRMFLWPVPDSYVISSVFGLRPDPFYGGMAYHNGIDIAAPIGVDVVAIQSGTVEFAGDRGSAGKAVILSHLNDVESRYYHLSEILVRQGESVDAGQLIGKVGNTGMSTGPHLHLELLIKGVPADPLLYY